MIKNDREITRRRFCSTIIYSLIRLLALVTPYIMGLIVDDYIPNKKTVNIYIGIFLFMLIPFLCVILNTVYNYYTIKYVREKGNHYALKIMENLVYKDISYFDKQNSIEILSYASKEIVGYVNFIVSDLSQYYVQYIMAIVTWLLLVRLNVYLGLLQILYIPLVLFPTKYIMKNVDKEIKCVVEKNAEISQIKGDIFKAIKYVKLNEIEEKKLHEVKKRNDEINSVWGKVSALDTLNGLWTSGFTTALFTGVTFGLGAILIVFSNQLQVGKLISIITYAATFYECVNTIIQTDISKAKKESEFQKVFEYLEMEGEREENKGKKELSFSNEICFHNCSFSYDEKPVLDKFNLVIRKGKWTGIVGPSGKGKSTLFSLIMKLYPVKENQIFIDDVDISQIDAFSIRDRITLISQDVFLFPGTIADNLRLVNSDITENDIRYALDFVGLMHLIEHLPQGIDTDIGEAGKLLSGGERQRLSIAIGLLKGNDILLLDEVTSNLDVELEEKIAFNFHQLVQKGYTIISISHRLNFLKYADEVIEL